VQKATSHMSRVAVQGSRHFPCHSVCTLRSRERSHAQKHTCLRSSSTCSLMLSICWNELATFLFFFTWISSIALHLSVNVTRDNVTSLCIRRDVLTSTYRVKRHTKISHTNKNITLEEAVSVQVWHRNSRLPV